MYVWNITVWSEGFPGTPPRTRLYKIAATNVNAALNLLKDLIPSSHKNSRTTSVVCGDKLDDWEGAIDNHWRN